MSETSATATTPITCHGLWKIFGTRAEEAMNAVRQSNLGKDQVFTEFGCVVGVADVSLEVQEGEIFCIMGLSGSGKSTLVRHINRLIEPTAGEVRIHGRDINGLAEEELRRLRSNKVGMVFQHMALWPHRSVVDNVAFGLEVQGVKREVRRDAAIKALEQVNLAEWVDRYPDELSGGMKQRVGLARAIASDPPILLMDEPFSALDPLIRRQLQDQFLALSKVMKKTTVFITHDLDEAIRIGDRIAIMNAGKIIQTGTPEEIVTNPADDYVAEFVAGISRLQIVRTRSVMQPISRFRKKQQSGDIDLAAFPAASADLELDGIVDLFVEHGGPVRVVDTTGDIGVITTEDLLRGLQGRQETQ